jgi:hypothetical protein
MNKKLGRLSPVSLREVWSREDSDFTPWLAQAENITLLGEAIGIPLEVEDTEVNVGPFRADVLCSDMDRGNQVLIENQIEKTDHGHLGQLLTYMAGLGSPTVVWIASRFTDQHRAAIDWLNEISTEEFNFFGVQIEAWKINNGPAAPRFDVIARPNEWTKKVRSSISQSSPNKGERAEQYREFWSGFSSVERDDDRVRLPSPSGLHWVRIGHDIPGGRLIASYSFVSGTAKLFTFFDDKSDTRPGEGLERYNEVVSRWDQSTNEKQINVDWLQSSNSEFGYGLSQKVFPPGDSSPDEPIQWFADTARVIVSRIESCLRVI